MNKTTFKKIVVMTLSGDITADELQGSLNQLLTEVKGREITGVLVDVSALSKNDNRLKEIGEATGPWARKTIDPKLASYDVEKIAFVSPSGKYHGKADGSSPFVKSKSAPAKHYFTDHSAAINWLQS